MLHESTRGMSTGPVQRPPSRRQLVKRIADFSAERIATVGGITRDALLEGGFTADQLDLVDAEVRDTLRRRNLLAAPA